jgi:hypothetical protein
MEISVWGLDENGVQHRSTQWDILVGNLSYMKVSLTSSQILNLRSTPINLIAAPWAGYYLDVKEAYFRYTYGTVTYVGQVDISYSGVATIVTTDIITWVANVAQCEYQLPWSLLSENTAIVCTAPANPTLWDGTLDIVVYYRTIAF